MQLDLTASLIKLFPIINGGLLVTLLTVFLKNRFENRKLTIEENSGLRTEFIAEMKELREEVKGLRTENSNLREEVRQLHGVIDGMRRENLQAGISSQRAVMDSFPRGVVPPSTLAALDRLKESDQ